MRTQVLLSMILAASLPQAVLAQNLRPSSFRAGAAKVDVTPSEKELPKNWHGILDRLYSRAIVLDNGAARAALITVDDGAVSDATWRTVTERVEKELGIPAANVLLTATHTHSALRQRAPDYPQNIFESVKLAQQNLTPARLGYGTGVSYINVNRNMIDPKTRRWREEPNYDGPSDKTVAVVKIESMSGQPIAVYYNYAVHPVLVGQLDMISADIPGAVSRYIEDSLDDKIIALWSSGAAGDQNPIYYQQTYDLREIRIQDYAKRGIDISNSMPPGGEGLNRNDATVAKLMNQQKQMILSMGQLLGEEVLHVMRSTNREESTVQIYSDQKTVTCPGRDRTNEGRAGIAGTYKDADPVAIRLGLLMIGDVAVGSVNAGIYSAIGQRLKKESPYAKTMLTTAANGFSSAGYIPDDASYGHETFEVLSSRLKPGCAESAIVNGIIDMMPRIMY